MIACQTRIAMYILNRYLVGDQSFCRTTWSDTDSQLEGRENIAKVLSIEYILCVFVVVYLVWTHPSSQDSFQRVLCSSFFLVYTFVSFEQSLALKYHVFDKQMINRQNQRINGALRVRPPGCELDIDVCPQETVNLTNVIG